MWSERRSISSEKAVHMAFDEIGRLMELRILCRCISLEKRGDLARPTAKNVGVKAGLLVPEVDIDLLPIPRYEPADIRAKLVGFASTASFDSVLHLTVLRSWISAYSYAECGGRRLATYSEPILIDYSEKLDDEKASEKDKVTSLASDVEVEVNEPMRRLKSTAVEHSHMRNEGHFNSLCRFASAYRGSTYFKKVSSKRKKLTCSPKVLRLTASADEQTDSLVLDARVIKKKIDSMTKMLESCGSKFSSDDKARLGEEMKCSIMEKVVTVSDKVRSMAEKRDR
ncbi:hypothetical protein SASPL_127291 [Salvia splendens]|uniref:Uncharacterized protein n=1 Tax=Salvia splendens TaxID=180675 RepID=A0A8X8XL30_SALSN|nr:hypothetical protein SASPL_127291 [Salvia splendens]